MPVDGAANYPNLDSERSFWSSGFRFVAGVDEVGRGAMAGPLMAAAVILPIDVTNPESECALALRNVRDSKLLSEEVREDLCPCVQIASIAWGVGIVDVDELDAIGLSAANRLAMERAVLALPKQPDVLLLDAMTVDLGLPQVGLIDGDARSLSIAAASIVAKVTRDRFMTTWHVNDPRYGFSTHKGYCTPAHLKKLELHGPCSIHRRSFAPVARVNECEQA